MTIAAPNFELIQKRLPPPPGALVKLLSAPEELTSPRTLIAAMTVDNKSTEQFLRLAMAMLPGRRLSTIGDTLPLLGEVKSARLAMLAAGSLYLHELALSRGWQAPLLRHAVAAAVAAEPLARSAGVVDPLAAFALGLLHSIGDAAGFGGAVGLATSQQQRAVLGAALLGRLGASDPLCSALVEYAGLGADAQQAASPLVAVLGTADLVATALGYAAPAPFAQPDFARFETLAAPLLVTGARLCDTVEELVAVLLESEHTKAARQIAQEVAPIVLPEMLERMSARDLGPLPVLFARVSSASDEDSLAFALTAAVVEELGAERSYYLRLEGGRLRRAVLAVRGNVPIELSDAEVAVARLPRPLRQAIEKARPVLHEVAGTGLEFLHSREDRPAYFAPVVAGKEVLGLLAAEVDDARRISPDLLAAISAHVGLALKAVDLKRLSDAAKIDELTGLLNRRGILETLDRLLERPDMQGKPMAIALIDCDHLKKVNDNFGHLYGDEYLRRISEVVRLSLRGTDELGRYGGDEFLAVLPEIDVSEAEQILNRTRERVELAGLESHDGLLLSISIGAVVRGETAIGRDKLIKLADTALYSIKQQGRNSVRVIDGDAAPDLAL
jgi:diguanylate cyclase (GGDEF)-like protein